METYNNNLNIGVYTIIQQLMNTRGVYHIPVVKSIFAFCYVE